MACQICVEPLNKSNHSPSTCNHCGLIACKTCIRTYLNSNLDEPHCMKCKVVWDDEFVLIAVNKTYYHSDLKEKRKDRLVDLEKSRLPSTQTDAKHFLIKEKMSNEIAIIQKENDKMADLIFKNKKQMKTIRDKSRIELGVAVVERKEFIMRCQVSECKGFLSTGYKCELCSTTTCAKCLEVIEGDHECKPENIASAEMIKKETKPCPKCATRIHKIDGCNQMWCTNCNTPWDWPTGKVVFGVVHNPHYYEYLKNQTGLVPRNPGDVICGGMPDIYILQQFVSRVPIDLCKFIKINVFAIHRFIVDVHYIIIDANNRNRFERNLTDTRVQFMLNRISEEIFRQHINLIYNKRDKSRANIRLLELIDTIGTDLMQNYFNIFEKSIGSDIILEETCKFIAEFNELINYYESLRTKKYNMFKQSGIYISIKRVHARDEPIDITDVFKYSLTGLI